MIVDQAEDDAEIVQDPFLEAGIVIPTDQPYQDKVAELKGKKESKIEKRASRSNEAEKEEVIPLDTVNVPGSN